MKLLILFVGIAVSFTELSNYDCLYICARGICVGSNSSNTSWLTAYIATCNQTNCTETFGCELISTESANSTCFNYDPFCTGDYQPCCMKTSTVEICNNLPCSDSSWISRTIFVSVLIGVLGISLLTRVLMLVCANRQKTSKMRKYTTIV